LSYELLYECTHWWIIIGMLMLIDMMLYDVAHRWWILWNYIVELLLCSCCRCRWCRQVVDVVRCCWISCWFHAYSYKVGGSCPVECLIIHTTLVLRAYALHVDLRADALHVELRAYALTRWLVPHAFCTVKLSLGHCIVVIVELLSCCRWFNVK